MDTKGLKILITGASGFIGSFLCEEALGRGMLVWAGMREKSSRRWLQSEWLNFCTLDLANAETLCGQLERFKAKHGKWDVIVHAGGATKCLHREDFDLHNYVCTRNLVDTLVKLDMVPRQFIYVSSLSILGPIRERRIAPHPVVQPEGLDETSEFINRYTVRQSVYEPMMEQDEPEPNTAYGESKVKSERYLNALTYTDAEGRERKFPVVIFRPAGVYGPREKDYFLMAKSIKSHVDFAIGYAPQEITFVYVRDLVGAIFAAVEKGITGRAYFVSDGYVYSSRAFSDLIQRELGVKCVWHITAPLWVLKVVSYVSERLSVLTGKPSTLNGDKYNIMRQRNWQCDIRPMCEELGFTPQWNLECGVKETINWYKKEKWL